MEKLSDDIIHEVFACLDIDSFFAARRTCRRLHATTNARLALLTAAVARNTFPDQTRLLQRPAGLKADLAWLNDLRYQQLGAIALECAQGRALTVHSSRFLNDEWDRGNSLRRKLVLGWRVLGNFRRLAREVSNLPVESLKPRRELGSIPRPPEPRLEVYMLREYVLFDRCEDFISELCAEDVQCLGFVLEALLDHNVFNGKAYGRESAEYSSWAAWRLIKLGPQAFWKMWWVGRNCSKPYLNASRILLETPEDSRHPFIALVESECFSGLRQHLARTQLGRTFKTAFNLTGEEGQPALSASSMNVRLCEPLERRIMATQMLTGSPAPADDPPIRDVLIESVPIFQTLVWSSHGRLIDELDVEPIIPQGRRAPQYQTNMGYVEQSDLSWVNRQQEREQMWLDRERHFSNVPLDREARFARARQLVDRMDPSVLTPLADERGERRPGKWARIKCSLGIGSDKDEPD